MKKKRPFPKVILLTFFLTVFVFNASAQKVTLSFKNEKFEKVLNSIKQQTGLSPVYSEQLVNLNRKVSINVNSIPVEDALKQLLIGTNLDYDIKKNKLYLVEKKNADQKNTVNQSKKITGLVTDEKGDPIIGATVKIIGSNAGTISDVNGKFSIEATDQAVLSISYIGYISTEINASTKGNIIIVLKEESKALNEVLVIGYGSQSKVKTTNSISTLKSEDLLSSPIASFEEGLAGQLAGVQIVQTSGDPGSSSTINIRGVSTISANAKPLIVIDGLPSENLNLNSINPSDIERIDILKDAASASIYGSRGSNGVIFVTTKKGDKGGFKLTFDGYTGLQEVEKTVEMQDAYERAKFGAQALINRGKAPLPQNQPYLIGIPGIVNTDWQDEIFKIAPMHNISVTASGGSKNMDYFISGGYLNQDGIVLGSKYQRVNFRFNLNFDFQKMFKAAIYLAPTFSDRNRVSDDDHKGNGVIMTALIANPSFKPYNSDGSLNLSDDMMRFAIDNGQAPVENPVALALLNTDKRIQRDLLGGAYIEFRPSLNIMIKSYLGLDYSSSDRKTFSPNTVGSYSVLVENAQSTAFKSFYERQNLMFENTATYQNIFFDKHNFKLLLGQSYQTEDMNTTGSNPLLAQISQVDGVITTTFPKFQEKWALISYFSRFNYDYQEKYILSGSIRRDGSSRFGLNTKWGWFPSFSGAWRINKEEYFTCKIVSDLKLRTSWGVTGNNGIPNYGAIPLLGNANYDDLTGYAPNTSPNQNLSWEQTNTLDFGIDIGLIKNKISFTADYYNAITNGLLLEVPVPAHSGYTSSLRNIGKVQNSGFEFALSIANIKLGVVKWSSTMNVSTNKNIVLELGPGQERILKDYHITEVGKPMGSYYTYKKIGVFNSQEQINNYPVTQPEMRLGDYIFADLDEDGKITSNDKYISGDFFPDYTFGFSNNFKYRNFAFSFLIQGKQGYEVFNGTSFFIRNLEGWSNGHNDINNYYTTLNPDATYASPGKHVKTYEQSDLFVEDASYFRLKKVSLKYNISGNFLKKLSMKSATVYLSATNLFTLTKYTGYNPEVSSNNNSFNSSRTTTPGFDYGAYPVAKTIVAGFNLTL